jgi:hypothetical protein
VCAGMSNCSVCQKFLAKGHWKMICVAFSSVSPHTSQVQEVPPDIVYSFESEARQRIIPVAALCFAR